MVARVNERFKPNMEIENVIQELKAIGVLLATNSNAFSCYIFGSALTVNYPNDIDILVLYDNIKQLENFKEYVKTVSKIYPIHLIYLTFAEEKELNFIQEQNAEQVF